MLKHKKKIKFETYGGLIDQAFSQFNENLMNNQDPHSQTENDETPGAEYPNESQSEEGEMNKNICTYQPHATNITR